jgi:uncharacterized protein
MTLHRGFEARAAFASPAGYRLLPFRFAPFDADRYIVTNDVGEYVLLPRCDLVELAAHRLPTTGELYRKLKARHFLFDDDSKVALDLLALKARTRAETTAELTGLHIFVVTLRCDHSCHYCQVSRQTTDRTAYDMSLLHAERALQIAFASPSSTIKLEFQGGEPLLAFERITQIVERAEHLAEERHKHLELVITSNLSQLSENILAFCEDHRVTFSTSLDGPEEIHNAHRPLPGGNSHQTTIAGIAKIHQRLGPDAVTALMTTTPASLLRVEDIVDEYARRGLGSIFLRSLSPYGFAARSRSLQRYRVSDWMSFYQRGLAHVLQLNRQGVAFREEQTAILIQKMFSPSGSGYVDLQSPAGLGIGALVYNYDGSVYASDEGRMLAEMGDHSLRLGSVDDASFEQLITQESLVELLESTLLESAPMCSDCPFLPFCGADPAFHLATAGEALGHKAFSAFCEKQMSMLRHVISLLEDDPEARDILIGWV